MNTIAKIIAILLLICGIIDLFINPLWGIVLIIIAIAIFRECKRKKNIEKELLRHLQKNNAPNDSTGV